jgi:hypothetical protein
MPKLGLGMYLQRARGVKKQTPAVAAPSSLSYPSSTFSFTAGIAITSLSPTVTGTATGYSVSPALPSGLSLNTTSGVISGTPNNSGASGNYTITASNSGGSTTTILTIAVGEPAATTVPTPMAYWPMEEGGSNNYRRDVVGTYTLTSPENIATDFTSGDRPWLERYAASFDGGSTNYLKNSDISVSSGAFSVSCWLRPKANASSDNTIWGTGGEGRNALRTITIGGLGIFPGAAGEYRRDGVVGSFIQVEDPSFVIFWGGDAWYLNKNTIGNIYKHTNPIPYNFGWGTEAHTDGFNLPQTLGLTYGGTGFTVLDLKSDNTLRLFTDTSGYSVSIPEVNSPNALTVDNTTWYHVVATCTTTTNKLYVNGSLVASTTHSGADKSWKTFSMGGWPLSGAYEFPVNAVVDDVKVWDSELSIAQVKSVYNNNQTNTEVYNYSVSTKLSDYDPINVAETGNNWGGWFRLGTQTADWVAGNYIYSNAGASGNNGLLIHFDNYNKTPAGVVIPNNNGGIGYAINDVVRSLPPYGNSLAKRISNPGNPGNYPGYATNTYWKSLSPFPRNLEVGKKLTVTVNFTLGAFVATPTNTNHIRFGLFNSCTGEVDETIGGVTYYKNQRISSNNELSNAATSNKFGATSSLYGYHGYNFAFQTTPNTSGNRISRRIINASTSTQLVQNQSTNQATLVFGSNSAETRMTNGVSYVFVGTIERVATGLSLVGTVKNTAGTTLHTIQTTDTIPGTSISGVYAFDTFTMNLSSNVAADYKISGFSAYIS